MQSDLPRDHFDQPFHQVLWPTISTCFSFLPHLKVVSHSTPKSPNQGLESVLRFFVFMDSYVQPQDFCDHLLTKLMAGRSCAPCGCGNHIPYFLTNKNSKTGVTYSVACPSGFEPLTYSLEDCCSIRLS